jgi:hypothetical protein
MERLRRTERERAAHERLASAAVAPAAPPARRSLFDRLLRKR